jgi:hypothetical protein
MSASEFLKPNATYKELRYTQQNIWRVANGLRKTYKGYYWKY